MATLIEDAPSEATMLRTKISELQQWLLAQGIEFIKNTRNENLGVRIDSK